MTTRATLITCLLLLYAPSSHAWTWLNHVTIAQVAYEELSPSTRLYVDRVSDALYQRLTTNPQASLDNYTGASKFARLAALPDIVRNWHLATVYGSFGGTLPPAFQPHQGANTAPWHYINFSFPYESDCDLVVTPNLTEVLPVIETAFTEGADDQSKGIALAFLLHMVGDAHQPLHTTARATGTGTVCTGDRGGNDFCLRRAASGNCTKTLHAFWDEAGGQYTRNARVIEYANQLWRDYSAEELTDEDELDVMDWIDEGRMIAAIAYATPEDVGAHAVYDGYVEEVSRRRMALAAHRLARMVEDLVGQVSP